jgi:hypothetical protein
MEILFYINNIWLWFCISSGFAMIFAFMMRQLGFQLMTKRGTLRLFSLMDLEFPSDDKDIPTIINGIYKLPTPAQQQRVVKDLKSILYIDFLFMPAVYCSIFLICLKVALKLEDSPISQQIFIVFAYAQILAWIFDICENFFLLSWIRPDLGVKLAKNMFRLFNIFVRTKWIIALIGGVSALMMIIYFWIKGSFSMHSLNWMCIYFGELILFLVAYFKFNSPKKADFL